MLIISKSIVDIQFLSNVIFLNVKCIFMNKNVYTYHMKTANHPPACPVWKFFLKETSARKLEERNSIKINNKTLDELVIEE